MGSAGCHNKSQIYETDAGVKWKRLIQVLWPGRMVDPCLKHNPPFLIKCSSYRDREGRNFSSLSNYIAIIWHIQVLYIHLYSLWYVRVLSNDLSSFRLAHCKNLPLCHLGQWKRLPSTPWLSRVGPMWGVLQDSQSESQELLQPSALLPMMDMVPTHWSIIESFGVSGAPLDFDTTMSSVQLPCNLPIWSAQMALLTLVAAAHAPPECL